MSYRKLFLLATLFALLPQFTQAAPIDVLRASIEKMKTAHYRSESTTTDNNGKTRILRGEGVGFDRLHTLPSSDNPREMILVPEGGWKRTGNGAWQKMPDREVQVAQKLMGGVESWLPKNITNTSDDGMTTFNGQPAHAYSYDVVAFGVKSHSKMYLNSAGLLIGSESTAGPFMGHTTHTVQKVAYDNSISVNAPQ
jgi:hypothetical protein